ncbi:MAG: hypothetical protein ACLQUY_08810 [Ktedonobacterales bacterium]
MLKSRTPQRSAANLSDPLQSPPFDAGRLTSDGGLVWITRAEATLGLSAALAGQIRDWRRWPAN